jgi:hypothetical protein
MGFALNFVERLLITLWHARTVCQYSYPIIQNKGWLAPFVNGFINMYRGRSSIAPEPMSHSLSVMIRRAANSARNLGFALVLALAAPCVVTAQPLEFRQPVQQRYDTISVLVGEVSSKSARVLLDANSLRVIRTETATLNYGETKGEPDGLLTLPSGRRIRCVARTQCARLEIVRPKLPPLPVVVPRASVKPGTALRASVATEAGEDIWLALDGQSSLMVETELPVQSGLLRIGKLGSATLWSDSILQGRNARAMVWDGQHLWVATGGSNAETDHSTPFGLLGFSPRNGTWTKAIDSDARPFDPAYSFSRAGESSAGEVPQTLHEMGGKLFVRFGSGFGVKRTSDTLWTWFYVRSACTKRGTYFLQTTEGPRRVGDESSPSFECYDRSAEILRDADRFVGGFEPGGIAPAIDTLRAGLQLLESEQPERAAPVAVRIAELFLEAAIPDSVSHYAIWALSRARAQGDTATIVSALAIRALAEVFEGEKQLQRARATLAEAERFATVDTLAQARLAEARAIVMYGDQKSEPAHMRELSRAALAYDAVRDEWGAWRARRALYSLAYMRRDRPLADSLFSASGSIAPRVDNLRILQRGTMELYDGKYAEAANSLRYAVEIFERLQDPQGEALAREYLSHALAHLRLGRESCAELDRARRFYLSPSGALFRRHIPEIPQDCRFR